MSKEIYKAVSNYIRNTQKLTREELEEIVRNIIEDIVKQKVEAVLKQRITRLQIERLVDNNLGKLLNSVGMEIAKKYKLEEIKSE